MQNAGLDEAQAGIKIAGRTINKKAECRRIDAFEMWCWRRLLRVPWSEAPPSMGFSRQECWSGVPLPSPMSMIGMCKIKSIRGSLHS